MRRLWLLFGLSLLGSGAFLLDTLTSADGWERRARAAHDLDAVEAEIGRSSARADELRREIAALRTRPEVLERAVRDELGYVRTGDVVLDLGGR